MDPLDHFEFSQSSLQDYVDCQRRFQLRYLQHVAWPAVQAEPARENERHILRGQRFHRLTQQYLIGVPEARLTRIAEADEDENLLRWWLNFLDCIPEELTSARHVEVTLAVPLERFRLLAKYDLVMNLPDGRVVIYDWKTTPRRPSRSSLLARMQTRVYPYLLAQAGSAINKGCSLEPAQISMIYWFAEPGQAPELLSYSSQKCQDDEIFLLDLVHEIQNLGPGQFSMASSEKSCRFCVYRSLCNRGVSASSAGEGDAPEMEMDEEDNLNFDLEQIGEISF